MKPPDDPEVAAWLAKAEGDLQMARFALRPDAQLWDQTCYHAQQAAEKGLKALIVALALPVPHTHSLPYLLKLVLPGAPRLHPFVEDAPILSAYATAPRYPSFLASETETQARDALRRAGALVAAVRETLAGRSTGAGRGSARD